VADDTGPYAAAWQRYRRWRLAFWVLFLLYLPSLAGVSRALGWTRGSGAPIVAAAIVWMIALAIVGYPTSNFPCPRCGKPFFRKFDDRPGRMSWQRNPFARRCMHCGLPKRAGRDPGPHEVA
jgi:hypothetical protein